VHMKLKLTKEKILDGISSVIIFALALTFVAKFAGPIILRSYIQGGIGNCQKVPVLCIVPEKEIDNPSVSKEYLLELLPCKFPEMQLCVPKGFKVIKEKITKVYYKRRRRQDKGATIYLLYKKPNFFVNLFPQAVKQGIKNDYEFLNRTMSAKVEKIDNLTDAFFVIMKTVFTPNLGAYKNIKMVKFTNADKKGFITYNLSPSENYFDCNIFNEQGDFFKIYIKDKAAGLDLDKVFTIISTINRVD